MRGNRSAHLNIPKVESGREDVHGVEIHKRGTADGRAAIASNDDAIRADIGCAERGYIESVAGLTGESGITFIPLIGEGTGAGGVHREDDGHRVVGGDTLRATGDHCWGR